MPDFSFDEDEPVKSYTKTKGNGAGCIWLSALAAILIPTAIFTVWMWVSYSNIKDAAAKASAENKAIEKRYPGANVAPEKEIRPTGVSYPKPRGTSEILSERCIPALKLEICCLGQRELCAGG